MSASFVLALISFTPVVSDWLERTSLK